jgi:hypothetical protein
MCSNDSQCADAGVNGRCIQNTPGLLGCLCTSDTCADDSACPAGQTCACHGSPNDYGAGNHCLPSDCRVDADCGPCGWCSPTVSSGSCLSVVGYYCHTPKDQCVNDSDCLDAGLRSATCGYDASLGYWRCIFVLGCP